MDEPYRQQPTKRPEPGLSLDSPLIGAARQVEPRSAWGEMDEWVRGILMVIATIICVGGIGYGVVWQVVRWVS